MKSAIQLVPYENDLLDTVAREIIRTCHTQLPDLTKCRIFVTDMAYATRLRQALLEAAGDKGIGALLGPSISTLEVWLNDKYPVRTPVLTQAAQELVLVEAIRQAKDIFNTDEPWALTNELLQLFDELTRANCKPDKDLETFQARLALSYQLQNHQASPFQRESRIVYTLWKAWHEQLEATNQLDAASAEFVQLQQSLSSHPQSKIYWFAGLTSLSETQSAWLKALYAKSTARIFLHGNVAPPITYHPDSPLQKVALQLGVDIAASRPATQYSQFLDAVFSHGKISLPERSKQFTESCAQDPLHDRLRIFEAENPEQEARAIDIQVRSWLLEGKETIAILTEDRRLARRVRALLERANVNLVDAGGWALSTTSAASVIERWLETVEQDFAYTPLLDTLKSPFICLSEEREQHLQSVRRLEQDIIVHENIASSLKRYYKHLNRRADRLIESGTWIEKHRKALEILLAKLDQAAEPLTPLLTGEHPVSAFTQALQTSLELLNCRRHLESDAAGQRLLQEIHALHKTANEHHILLSWQEFRGWLGQTLERYTFKNTNQSGPVQLLSLSQGRHQRFSGLILAGCTAEHLPGTSRTYAFFNQSVRSELGLRTHIEQLGLKLHDFRHALEAAPDILLTCSTTKERDPELPSPWLTAIKTFHALSYQTSLTHPTLKALVTEATAFVVKDNTALPGKQIANPIAHLPASLIPTRWSASMHQNLISCPYKFFAANGLKLQAQEEIRLALAKADYGSLIHRILQAFHSDIDRLPGPWEGPISSDNRDASEKLLMEISSQVFKSVIRDNFHARSWLETWLQTIPKYIDWQEQQSKKWRIHKAEQKMETLLDNGISSYGVVDRIDIKDDQYCILDYKTGKTATIEEVITGEAVQLANYALLAKDEVSEISYLELNNKKVTNKTRITGNDIQPLLDKTRQRLNLLTTSIANQADLPAWGDNNACRFCQIDVICRRESWTQTDE